MGTLKQGTCKIGVPQQGDGGKATDAPAKKTQRVEDATGRPENYAGSAAT